MQHELKQLKTQLGATNLIAVSKQRSTDSILELYEQGVRDFGENRADELVQKAELLAGLEEPIRWHFIGRLQTNKVAMVVRYATCVHSLDRTSLAVALQKEAKKQGKLLDVLVQVNISKESSKAGFMIEDIIPWLSAFDYQNLRVIGLMCMGPNVSDETQIASVFEQAQALLYELQTSLPHLAIRELSMGMSDDYSIALQYGATMVRIGSLLFP